MQTTFGTWVHRILGTLAFARAAGIGVVCLAAGMACAAAGARELRVTNAAELKAAIAAVTPGDTIVVPPGTYDMGQSLATGVDGIKGRPIVLACAGDSGYAQLKANGQVAFRIKSKFWTFRGIHFQGDPARTEATVFMDGPNGCGHVRFIDCRISGSKAHGMKGAKTVERPVHDVVIEHTELFDTGSTGFDLVCGDDWVLRGNYVHDYGKAGGVTYGIFLKGGGRNGVVDGNVVDGGGRSGTVGISFGGGLTGPQWLGTIDGKPAPEHDKGVAMNNIVLNTGDVALHANNASNCVFVNNLAWNCQNFQRQGSYPPDPLVANNLLAGRARGAGKAADNVSPQREWFTDSDAGDFRLTPAGAAVVAGKGAVIPAVTSDFFGTARKGGKNVLGPVLPGARHSTTWIDRRLKASDRSPRR